MLTAAAYGLGHSEEIVAQALAGWHGPRPYVFTKCGLRWDEKGRLYGSLKADSIRGECEASLKRLRVEAIDLYQIHWPTGRDADIEEGWGEMARLQQAGKLRWIGVSNFSVEEIQGAQAIAPVTSLQPRYSLISRQIEAEVLPYCERQGIGVIVYSPMHSGLLTGTMTRERAAALPESDWRKGDPDFSEPLLSRHLALVERLRALGVRHDRSPGEIAIAWALHHPAVTGAIVGARSAEQVEGVMRAADLALTPEEIQEIEAPTAAVP